MTAEASTLSGLGTTTRIGEADLAVSSLATQAGSSVPNDGFVPGVVSTPASPGRARARAFDPTSAPALGVDAYQLTTLLTHDDRGCIDDQVSMGFFFRRMPRHRTFVVFAGLRRLLEHAADMHLAEADLAALDRHPVIGPVLRTHPRVRARFRELHGFRGTIDAMPEGSLAFAGPAFRTDGSPLVVAGAQFSLYTPLVQIRTDLLRAKLVETPWLGFVNQMSMVASAAARIVLAARGKGVMEFGQRRTHPAAALDASWAAWIAGVASTSNMAAFARWGIPATGTMDHFAVQASEEPGRTRSETERAFFAAYAKTFAGFPTTMLVDTYDTEHGIRNAVEATNGHLEAIRIDSNVTPASVLDARRLLRELGSEKTKIIVSDALDEQRVAELSELVDGFGVGENIVCSPDAATGVGAVAKLVVGSHGEMTMKVSRGTRKATLPGALQVHRFADHDLVALAHEPAPSGTRTSRPLLERVWEGDGPTREVGADVDLATARERTRDQIAALPAELRDLRSASGPRETTPARKLVASDALASTIERLVAEAS